MLLREEPGTVGGATSAGGTPGASMFGRAGRRSRGLWEAMSERVSERESDISGLRE